MKPFALPLQMTRFSCGFFWGNVLRRETAAFVALLWGQRAVGGIKGLY